jgi:hypothetical protein
LALLPFEVDDAEVDVLFLVQKVGDTEFITSYLSKTQVEINAVIEESVFLTAKQSSQALAGGIEYQITRQIRP